MQTSDHDEEPDFDDAGPSRSQRRREALEVFELAEKLVALSDPQLAKVPLDSDLRAATLHARRVHQHVARKRETQYLAKLLRREDDDTLLAIREVLHHDRADARRETAALHRVEALRDKLVNEGDDGIGEVLELYPDADRQQLRHLARAAREERAAERPPAAFRELFKLLRTLDTAHRSGRSENGGDEASASS